MHTIFKLARAERDVTTFHPSHVLSLVPIDSGGLGAGVFNQSLVEFANIDLYGVFASLLNRYVFNHRRGHLP